MNDVSSTKASKRLKREGAATTTFAPLPKLILRHLCAFKEYLMSLITAPFDKARDFYFRIKRILEWIPILWKTRDWDHAYATLIWAYSLERLRDAMVNGYGIVGPKRLRTINTAIALLKRMSRDDYTDLDLDLLIRKYGPIGIPGIDKQTWSKEGIKELIDLSKKDQYLYKQDVRLFAKIMERHFQGFWD